MVSQKNILRFVILFLAILFLFVLNISRGSVSIPQRDVFSVILGQNASKTTWTYIMIHYRIPKAITAILVGIGLSISGLLMQTLFRNPLAGPYVLGLSSGSSLGVAFVVLGSGILPNFISYYLLSTYGIVMASCLGSFLVLIAVLIVAKKLKDTHSLLIVGLMFSSFSSAIVGILSYISTSEQLQKFTFWSMGNLGNIPWSSITILTISVSIGLLVAFINIKALDTLLLGENYARSLGLNISISRLYIIIATSILSGVITSFAGPIAFIGLAVPHIAKMLFQTSQHQILFWSTLFLGAAFMLICDLVAYLPLSNTVIPINAITSLIGAPIVILILLKKI